VSESPAITENKARASRYDQAAKGLCQSLILTGNDSVVLRDEAKRLAASFICTANGPDRPCGKCIPCCQIERETYPYCFTVAPQGAANLIPIDSIRELQKKLVGGRVGEGQTKVAVFLDAHRMREESQNSLLKILEEPPENTLLLLLTEKPQDLLPTIRSRCGTIGYPYRKPVPDAADRALVLDVLRAIRDTGYRGVFEKAAFVEGSRKKNIPGFLTAMEYVFRAALIHTLTFGSGGVEYKVEAYDSGSGVVASGGALIEALRQVWKAGYLLERNGNKLLVLENLFLQIKTLHIMVAEGGCRD